MKDLESIATRRFLDALNYAVELHGSDPRKGTSIPYVAHLFGVCALVLTDGGSEDEAIAALLHDALEDHPAETSREVITKRFGSGVCSIVEGCTDTPPDYTGGPKGPLWRERKQVYINHLKEADPKVCRVALADKLDNVRAMLADYRQVGEQLWKRFNAGKEDQLWYLREVTNALESTGAKGFLFDEFKRTAEELERLSGQT